MEYLPSIVRGFSLSRDPHRRPFRPLTMELLALSSMDQKKTLRLLKIKSLHDLYVMYCKRLAMRENSPIKALPTLDLEIMTQENS